MVLIWYSMETFLPWMIKLFFFFNMMSNIKIRMWNNVRVTVCVLIA